MKNSKEISTNNSDLTFVDELKRIVFHARSKAFRAINYAQVESNWLLGQRIVEQEQHGEHRAQYGKQILEIASQELTKEFGKGFSESNIRSFRKFYLIFKDIAIQQALSAELQMTDKKWQTLPAELGNPRDLTLSIQLSWSHYERLMRVQNQQARDWYLNEAAEQMWSYRTLDRNISSQYYERLLMSQSKEPVVREMLEKTEPFKADKLEFIKNPTVLEFLGLSSNIDFTETVLESAIISNISKFLMELGKGFSFVARQKLIKTEAVNYYVDLVFYNYILKCFVLIDLKTTRITHQNVGQMDMYVRMYDELMRSEGDNPTIGIILCSDTDEDIARYSILNGNEQLFASKYKLYLPSEEELRAEIERQKSYFNMQNKKNTTDE